MVEGQVASLATDVEKLKKDVADATQAAKKVSVLEGNVGTLAGQVVSLNQKVSQNEQDIAAVKKDRRRQTMENRHRGCYR